MLCVYKYGTAEIETAATWLRDGCAVAEGTEEAGQQAGQHAVVVHVLREAHRPGISRAHHGEIRSVDGYLPVDACKMKANIGTDFCGSNAERSLIFYLSTR